MKSISRRRKSLTPCLHSCGKCKYIGECALSQGAEIEREHRKLYKAIKQYGLPPEEDFYKAIAAAHIEERPDYYERLKRYVES